MHRELDKSGAPERAGDQAEGGRDGSRDGRIPAVLAQAYVGRVEDRVVEQVEELTAEVQPIPFGEFGLLRYREIEPLLKRGAEDVAAGFGETGFNVISGGNSVRA